MAGFNRSAELGRQDDLHALEAKICASQQLLADLGARIGQMRERQLDLRSSLSLPRQCQFWLLLRYNTRERLRRDIDGSKSPGPHRRHGTIKDRVGLSPDRPVHANFNAAR